MRFGNLQAQLWVYLISVFCIFIFWTFKKRKDLHLIFSEGETSKYMFDSFSLNQMHFKYFLRLAAVLLLAFALMRPQWGFVWQQISRRGVDIYFAVDVSKSMLAQDIKPDRLARTKLALKDIVNKIEGDRLGLIAFAGSAFIQCPLTVDYNGFLLSVDSLNTDLIPRGGTSLSQAIETAIKGFEAGQKKYSVLVLITDGESHEAAPKGLIEKLKKSGIRVYGLGIGTSEGELIPIVDEKGNNKFLKDRSGKVVKTRLDDQLLKDLALKTGGSYVQASSIDFGLERLYDKKIASLDEREIETKKAKRYEERYQLFAGLAFLFLLLDLLLTVRKSENE